MAGDHSKIKLMQVMRVHSVEFWLVTVLSRWCNNSYFRAFSSNFALYAVSVGEQSRTQPLDHICIWSQYSETQSWNGAPADAWEKSASLLPKSFSKKTCFIKTLIFRSQCGVVVGWFVRRSFPQENVFCVLWQAAPLFCFSNNHLTN